MKLKLRIKHNSVVRGYLISFIVFNIFYIIITQIKNKLKILYYEKKYVVKDMFYVNP